MAAGDLLTNDWDHEVSTYLIGSGPWMVDKVTGWLGRTIRTADTPYDLIAGASSSTDTEGPRLITLELSLAADDVDSAADAVTAFDDLEAAWVINSDVELHAQIPGKGHVYVVGRCRDIPPPELDELVNYGDLTVQVMFVANDPTIHVVTP